MTDIFIRWGFPLLIFHMCRKCSYHMKIQLNIFKLVMARLINYALKPQWQIWDIFQVVKNATLLKSHFGMGDLL